MPKQRLFVWYEPEPEGSEFASVKMIGPNVPADKEFELIDMGEDDIEENHGGQKDEKAESQQSPASGSSQRSRRATTKKKKVSES